VMMPPAQQPPDFVHAPPLACQPSWLVPV
jgi:hypothetical protein